MTTKENNIDVKSEAYNTGDAARQSGESRNNDCPYAIGTWERENWLAGFDSDDE